jgi:predicted alpha/beta-fold hydrolase
VPLLESSYQAPLLLRNGHAQTVFPFLKRTVAEVNYTRERLELNDGDFLDLDWSTVGSARCLIVSHGLEGSSEGIYVRGMVRAFNRRGWDALAWNFRGCSGEVNRNFRLYHSGSTDDLDRVVQRTLRQGYGQIAVLGFSLGGNVTLKWLGEQGSAVPVGLTGGVAISTPCDLRSSAEVMARPFNQPYMTRFLSDLREKIRRKQAQFPARISDAGFETIRTFREFDDRYTAPIHGFRDAEDYWAKASSRAYLDRIRVPVLLLNAGDDPFLSPECFPRDLAAASPWLSLEAPARGGHVGFVGGGLRDDEYYSERRALEFLGAEPLLGV